MVKSFKQYLKESAIDKYQDTYAIDVFDKAYSTEPTIKENIKDQILNELESFKSIAQILDFKILGGILTHQYNEFSDIDVNILFDVHQAQKEEVYKKLLSHNKDIASGKNAYPTQHPINYYVIVDKDKFDKANEMADNVFDLTTQKFIKQTIIKPIDIQSYYDKYKQTILKLDILKDELKADLIEYEHLKSIPRSDIESLKVLIEKQCNKVIEDLKHFIDFGNMIIKDRRDAFLNDMSPEEIRLYGSRNNLPQNIIYKMLEKYYYITLIHKLEDILKDSPPLNHKKLMKLLF